ncbi:branched-chain amino acid transport system ATP-binding protein [Paracoccus isoporae]|uniref:Branched-chain amino acid transport system ATP-binding protein n=1 Tax=Paracoccus isoporae TaxID=591205 RepID=A0A1G6ZLC3_9RHOB|nr:ABC transporter ATP-binding protein [Paracoccus isoporae]SDE03320.1 branched-chain amino acid transport system ATP-binding protein [Paracoccus isoporae]
MTAAIELSGISKSFGPLRVIEGVDLVIEKSSRHAVIGPNGAGKSTLFHMISGRLDVTSGVVRLFGEEIQNQKPHRIARKGLSRSFQITNLFPRLTAIEVLTSAMLWPAGVRYDFWSPLARLRDLHERAAAMARDLGIASTDTPSGLLSYADQRALELGVAVASDARVILLDEPTAGMNRDEARRTRDLILSTTEGRTLLMVEHDMDVVFGIADRISVLASGRIIASGTPEEIRRNAAVQEAYLGAEEEIA